MADNLQTMIISALKNYTIEIEQDIENTGVQVAREGRIKVMASTPVGNSTEKKLKDGWTTKKEKKENVIDFKIKNKNKPQIVHLLENGHVNVDGSFTDGKNFVSPVNTWCQKEFLERIERKIKGD